LAFVVFQSGLNLVFRNFIENIYRKGSVLDDRAFRLRKMMTIQDWTWWKTGRLGVGRTRRAGRPNRDQSRLQLVHL